MSETWNKEDNYAAVDHLHDDKYSKLGHTHTDTPDHNHDSVYSKLGHNHDSTYSKLGHSHSEFSLTSHNHDSKYSKLEHDHDDTYSKLGHVHDYAATDHNHDDVYSKLGHSHELIDMLPVGTVLWFGETVTLSDKWTVCTDLIGRYPLGATSGIGDTVEAGLPNITGGLAKFVDGREGHLIDGIIDGAFYAQKYTEDKYWWEGNGAADNKVSVHFDASRCSPVYKDGCTTVTPASMKLIPYIKIA